MSPVKTRQRLEQFRADGRVTNAEWRSVKSALAASPPKANDTARAVLDLWADASLRIDVDTRIDMRNYLIACGYPVPDLDAPDASVVPGIIKGNVSEPDTDFETLSRLTKRASATSVVAVLDTGFDLAHPELAKKAWVNTGEIPNDHLDNDHDGKVDDVSGWDFVDNDADLQGPDSHGTHVSGIATRGTDRVKEIACRVLAPIDGQKVAEAIDYAAAHGARAVNMSFSIKTPEDVRLVRAAIERHPQVVFVKSAGNDGAKLGEGAYAADRYLSAVQLPNLLVVAAANADGSPADYSNTGAPYALVAARGTDVLSTTPGGKYFSDDGTSMATPEVTSTIGKCLALNPALTPAQLRALLVSTSDQRPAWRDAVLAGGIINEQRAMRVAALAQLMSTGLTGAQAAAQLKLEAADQPALLGAATQVLSAR